MAEIENEANPPVAPAAPVPPATEIAKAPATPKLESVAAAIRNGLADSAISRDAAAWAALETRLPQIAAAIIAIKEA